MMSKKEKFSELLDHFKHYQSVRVYYEDTDAGGIVYHANYLKFAERARTEMLRNFGIEHWRTMKDQRVGFVVKECSMQFYKPGLLDDLLEVETEALSVRGGSLTLSQKIRKEKEAIFSMNIKLACINANGRATRIPSIVRERMSNMKILKGEV
jgi:acyl-CoA thioester hydrolase